MENNYSNWIKVYIIDVLPGLTAAVYILGFIYNEQFYSVFGINVEQYISLGEMFLDIISPLIFIVTLYLFVLLFFSWFHYNITRQTLKEIQEEKKKESKDNKENSIDENKFYRKNKKFVIGLLISTIIPLLLYIGVNELRGNSNGPSQVFLFSPFFLSFIILMFFAPISIISSSHPQRSFLIVEAVVTYYIYAAILFGYCGNINGRFVRDYDIARFEIKTNNGEVFTDKTYRYINQVHDKVFLLDKSTNNNVILGDDGILYMKFKYLSSEQLASQWDSLH